MELKLQKIGNSRGIRIPKKVIEQCGISDTVEIFITGKAITIIAKKRPRQGWAKAAAEMHRVGEDKLLIPDDIDAYIHDKWEE